MTLTRSALLSCCLVVAATTATSHAQVNDPLVPSELMVRVADAASLDACLKTLSAQFGGVGVMDAIESRQIYLISYSLGRRQSNDNVAAVLESLTADGTLVWGELNYEGQAAEGKTDSLWVSQGNVDIGQYGSQYATEQLGLPAAHRRSTGFGVVVAVLDTGIDPKHPVLAGSLAGPGMNFVVNGASTADVGDGVDNDGDQLVDEMVGHGTFVAGLIRLVAPDALLLPVTVLNSEGVGDAFNIGKGMFWAIDNGADVMNMSLGSTYRSFIIEDATHEAEVAGIFVVGAAGNWNLEDPREYPACDSASFGVAAVNGADLKAPFSNYNDKLDFAAPGHSEFVAGSTTEFDPAKSIISSVPGGGVAVWRGTSFATAFVSAGAALIRAQHPTWPDQDVAANQIVGEIESALTWSAIPIDDVNPAFAGMLGQGRIDLAAATALGPIQPVPGDLDGDGLVGSSDLAILLGSWGACTGCVADLNNDGGVGAEDLSVLLGNWG